MINETAPFGFGPWFVALLIHTDKQQTKIILNVYPDLYIKASNFLGNTDCWSYHTLIGPFESIDEATDIFNEWNCCKQRKTRIEFSQSLPYLPSLTGKNLCVWYRNTETTHPLHLTSNPYPYITVQDVKEIIKTRNK